MATEKEQPFSTNGSGTTIHVQNDLTTFTKIDSQWIISLNIKHRTIKLVEDNRGELISDCEFGKMFLGETAKASSMKKKKYILDFIKIKTSLYKGTIKRMKIQTTD